MGNYKRYYGNDNIETQMNAKELVLDKINASVDTLGMYIYAIAIGIDVKKFTRFMTLPVIDKLIKLSKSNVINPERSEASIVGSIKEIQNKFLNTENYSKYMSIRHAPSILEAISPGFKKSAKLTDYEAYKLFKGLIQGLDSSDIDDKAKLEKFDLEIRRIRDSIESGKIKKIRVQKYIAKKGGDDYDDLSSEDEFGGDGSVDIAESFNRWYQDSRKMVGSISKEDIEAINLFERIKDESGALKVLGQVLGINQKIKTEEYDFYKYNSTLSNFLNNLTNKYFLNLQKTNPKSSPESIMELLKSQLPALYNNENGFDFTLFLSDENYREKTIQEYSVLTKNSQINILEILASSEHFMGMISLTYSLSENVFKPSSSKYRTLNRIIKKIESEKTFGNNGILPKSISKDIYAKLSNYVDDLIIQQFLSQNNGMKVMINQGDPYSYIHDNEIIKSKSRGKNESIDLSTYEGRNKFTSWFENIIRNIQLNKQFRDDKGNLYKNESFSNAFINNIIPEYKRDMLTEEDYGIIKPSISISVNMTMQDAALKQKMVEGLKELKNVKYNGHNMLDLLFMYDLIVNRAKKNQSSFAGFIAEAYPMDNIKLISNQYISYLKEIDGNNVSFDYNKNDFLIRGIAEKQSSKPAPGAIYYNQYYDQSANKIKRDYIQDGVIFNLNLSSMHKNMPLNTSVVKTKTIDPGIIISINNSDIKITIKC